MKFKTVPAPHVIARNSVRRVMVLVLLALSPTLIVHTYWFGYGLPINIALASIGALLAEIAALRLRNAPVAQFATDGSAILTAVFLSIAIPPLAPWWITVSGAAFAMLFAKHLYGGLGYNVFNPAMVGYAALLVSFPAHMTRWTLPSGLNPSELSLLQSLHAVLSTTNDASIVNAISSATPLSDIRAGLILRQTMEEIHAQPIFGTFGGVGWEYVALATLMGGCGLLALRIIRWHIPVAMLASLFLCAGIMHVLDPGAYAGPLFHLFSGASMLGAFFIATDPVSAATSDRGRLIYGAGIGILTFVIRAWGSYPDGIAFAVLLMNAAVPLIDRYTVPRIYGHSK